MAEDRCYYEVYGGYGQSDGKEVGLGPSGMSCEITVSTALR
jgi:hypothetical protein